MSKAYEELEVCQSALGRLILRRRRPPGIDEDVYEIMLGDDLLMSSYLNESELQLSHLGIQAAQGDDLHVLVGGLGLGYTASAALHNPRVRHVTVIELLPEVIRWHAEGQVPLGKALSAHDDLTIRKGDFFAVVGDPDTDVAHPDGGYGAIIVDIDHAPDSWLDDAHQRFYRDGGLARAASLLAPGGAFAFWSAGEPNEDFLATLRAAFSNVATQAIEVYNPMIDEDQVDTVYIARGETSASVQ